MKYFDKTISGRHIDELGVRSKIGHDRDMLTKELLKWVPHLASEFNREYASTGVLDLNDLIQIGNLHMLNAIQALDNTDIYDKVEQEFAPTAWAYIKKSVKLKMRNEIDYLKDPMRSHRMNGEKRTNSQEDNFLTELFPDFFDEQFLEMTDDVSSWEIEQLFLGLDILMDKALSFKEKQILTWSYGLDCEKMNQKDIAKYFNMSHGHVRNTVSNSIKKLQEYPENKQIIESFYHF